MKLFLTTFLIIINLSAKDKIVDVRLSSINTKFIYERIENDRHYLVLKTNDNNKFYMRYEIIRGTKKTMQTKKGIEDYYIYELKCLKINSVYFNCIE